MTKLYSTITLHLLIQTAFVGVNAAFLNSNTNRSPLVKLNNRQHVTAIEAASTDTHADAFTTYMAKSHEDKLRAVKVAEDKKNIEIQDLKRQIEEIKSGSTTTTTSSSIVNINTSSDGSIEVISAKLAAYQTFMSQYIVRSQEDKFMAIRAAEEAMSRKLDDKLNAFMLNPADASAITIVKEVEIKEPVVPKSEPAVVAEVVVESVKEVVKEEPVVSKPEPVAAVKVAVKVEEKIKEAVKEETKTPVVPKPKPPVAVAKAPVETKKAAPKKKEEKDAPAEAEYDPSTPQEVIDADHGLRADGGVGGLSLAERVALGADSSAAGPVHGALEEVNGSTIDPACLTSVGTVINPLHRVYFERNTVVATAANAGAHNRWGVREEALAINYIADHLAIAAAGGGADATAAAAAGVITIAATSNTNGAVAENQKLEVVMNQEPKPEVVEADHGLRADGGVGGPSLSQRVNVGAQLLDKTK